MDSTHDGVSQPSCLECPAPPPGGEPRSSTRRPTTTPLLLVMAEEERHPSITPGALSVEQVRVLIVEREEASLGELREI